MIHLVMSKNAKIRMIKYLCFVYFNKTQEGFETNNTNKKIEIDTNLMKIPIDEDSISSSYIYIRM